MKSSFYDIYTLVQFSDLLNVFSPVQFDYDVGGKSAAQTGNVVSPDMRKQSAGL